MKKYVLAFMMLVASGDVAWAQDYQKLVREAMDCLQVDSVDRAEMLIKQALKAEPSLKANAILYEYLGKIAEQKLQYDRALEYYGLGLNVSPTTLSLLLSRASLYMRLDNLKRAQVDYDDVLDLNADHTEALFFRAYIRSRERQYKEARADYQHLLRLEPDNMEARIGLAMVNDKDRRPKEAMDEMNTLCQLYPHRPEPFLVRGGMEQDRKQYELALHDFSHAIELDPRNPECYLARQRLYLQMHKKKLAKQDAQSAIRLGADPTLIAQ